MSEPKRKLLGMDHAEMQAVVKEMGMPGFAARQMMEWVYVKRARSIDDMTNLSLKHREALSQQYEVGIRELGTTFGSAWWPTKSSASLSCAYLY